MKYSIVIPLYNKAEFILNAVESIKNQTSDSAYEIIIVDDGSTDNLSSLLNILQDNDNIILIRQNNMGVSAARNNGIQHANGEYICFLDADDVWYSNHLLVLDRLINKYRFANVFVTSHISVHNGTEYSSSDSIERQFCDEKDKYIANFLRLINNSSYSIIHTNSICLKKDFIIEYDFKFETGVKIGEDSDLWYRLALYTGFVLSKEITTRYIRDNSTATRFTSNTFDWVFAKRLSNIIDDERINSDRKKEAIRLIDRYFMACSRDYIRDSNKDLSRDVLMLVNYKFSIRFILSYFLTYLSYTNISRIYRFFNFAKKKYRKG